MNFTMITVGVFCPTDIPLSNLSHDITFEVPQIESSTVAVCVLGGDLTLDRIWGSVKVEFEFQGKTEVQFYEAERLVHFKNPSVSSIKMKCVNNLDEIQKKYCWIEPHQRHQGIAL